MTQVAEAISHTAGATRHVYPTAAMLGDYFRAAAGLVPVAAVFAIEPVGPVAATVLGGFGVVFGVFGLRTLLRHGMSVEMTDTELRATGAWHRTLAWAELDRMKLAYYSTRRDRRAGWMQLELGAGGARVTLDSRIDGFDRLVRRAAEAAAMRGTALSEATVANLESLGVRPPEFGAER